MLEFFATKAQQWETEQGFRRIRRYFVEEGFTWKKLWRRYAAACRGFIQGKASVLSYERWPQEVHMAMPDVRQGRDFCDTCIRDQVALSDPCTPVNRADLETEDFPAYCDAQQHSTDVAKRFSVKDSVDETADGRSSLHARVSGDPSYEKINTASADRKSVV